MDSEDTKSRSVSRGRARSRTRSLVRRFTRSGNEDGYVDPNELHPPSAPPQELATASGGREEVISPPPNLSTVGMSDKVIEALHRENERLNMERSQVGPRIDSPSNERLNMERSQVGPHVDSPALPNSPRGNDDTLTAISKLTKTMQDMAKDLREVQIAQASYQHRSNTAHSAIPTMEEILPPKLRTMGDSEPHHLKEKELKKIRDLRALLEYRFKPSKQTVAEWLRAYAKKVAIMATNLHPSLYNVILLENLDPISQEQLHSFLGGRSIQDWTPVDLHKIVLTALGGGNSEIDRVREFYAYHPKQDAVPPTTISKLIHKLYTLGAAAGVTQLQVYKKLIHILPPTAKQEIRSAIAARRSFNPSFVPAAHELLELTGDATESINQELCELYGKKKGIKSISFDGSEEEELSIFGIGTYPPNPNSNDRQFYPRLDKPPPDTCSNCLQLGHKYQTCRFKINCLLCGGSHPAPVCHIYKNKTPVSKACYHCSLKGILLHHATADCLLIKESQMTDAKND